jgi:hypothetical protein
VTNGGSTFLAPLDERSREEQAASAPDGPPTFSVLIPAFQAAGFAADAVRSARDQVPPPFEIVVCDDASTDDLAGALAEFRDEVKLVRRDTNGGEPAARNDAARAATGEYVVYLDADDVYLPGRLAALATFAAERPDLDVLTTNALLVGPDGAVLHAMYEEGRPFPTEQQDVEILKRNFVFGHAAVRRSRLLDSGGFDPEIRYTADWELWIRLILGGARVGAIAEPLSLYRIHRESLSSQRLAMCEGRLSTLRKTARDPRLDAAQRMIVATGIQREEQHRDVEALRAALQSDLPAARRLARRVVRHRGLPVQQRLKAGVTWLSPSLVAAQLRRRDSATWRGVGNYTFSADQSAPARDVAAERGASPDD